MLDSLMVALTTCYSMALAIETPIGVKVIPLPDSVAAQTIIEDTLPQPLIIYNSAIMGRISDRGRRTIVVHELTHIYWREILASAMWAAEEYDRQQGNRCVRRNVDSCAQVWVRERIEYLTEKLARMPMWQRLCGRTGPPS